MGFENTTYLVYKRALECAYKEVLIACGNSELVALA